jgi:AraC-like DNA-binding protein
MQSDVFECSLGADEGGIAAWQSMFAKRFDMRCEVQRRTRSDSFVRGWPLGDLLLTDTRLSHAMLWPVERGDGSSFLLQIVRTGNVSIEQRNRVWNVGPGEMVLIDTAHAHKQIVAESTRMIVVRIPRRLLRERGYAKSFKSPIAADVALADVQAVRDLIHIFVDQDAKTTRRLRRHQANQLLDLLDVVIEGPSGTRRVRSAEATLFRTKRYIERHLRNAELTAGTIASSVWSSVVHLNRLFRAEGTSLMRYVWNRRLDVAVLLLSTPDPQRLPIQDIALRCGFSSHAHFSRRFKERYGISPSEAVAVHNTSDALEISEKM